MNVEPATISQIRFDDEGRLVEISADAGGVVDNLRRIDAGFRVRLNQQGGSWLIWHEWHEGCAHNGEGNEGSSYLVNTAHAYQGVTGAWMGLDDRLVERMRQIGSEDYDFVGELDRQRAGREKVNAEKREEAWGDLAEKGAHALRKDLGDKSRAFIRNPEKP